MVLGTAVMCANRRCAAACRRAVDSSIYVETRDASARIFQPSRPYVNTQSHCALCPDTLEPHPNTSSCCSSRGALQSCRAGELYKRLRTMCAEQLDRVLEELRQHTCTPAVEFIRHADNCWNRHCQQMVSPPTHSPASERASTVVVHHSKRLCCSQLYLLESRL